MTIDSGQQALAADILKHANSDGYLQLTDSTELTISGGAVTAVANFYRVDTESNASTDDLDTITAGTGVADGHMLVLRAENASRTVVIKHNTGNILSNNEQDIYLDDSHEIAVLIYDGNLTKWCAFGPQSFLRGRQGGSSTNWASPGTTDYSTGSTKQYGGAAVITIANGQATNTATLTLPVTFAQVPLAIAGLGDVVDADVYAVFTETTVNSIALKVRRAGTSGSAEVWVNWLVTGSL